MRPIVREFFRGLRERDELDVIVPELLTAMGFELLSRPMRGTTQYGADVAAVGPDVDGERKLFLFSIKRGDLNRTEWSGASDQALRPSLEDIRDAYLRNVAPEHEDLPVVIVITIGGIVLENVLPRVNGYMRDQQTARISYRLWTGDTLAEKVLNGALREEVFPAERRSMLRKAAAMVEEPDVALAHFGRLIEAVSIELAQGESARVRLLYLALWILFVWGREAGNLDAPYRASELVVLRSWELLRREIESDNGRTLEASHTFREVVELHWRIWGSLYRDRILPHVSSWHALSFAVNSAESVDINLALFDTIGRVAIGGLWRLWLISKDADAPRLLAKPPDDLNDLAHCLAAMIFSNPILFTPIADDQAIDISLALMLLVSVPETRDAAGNWIRQIAGATRLAYLHHLAYPTIDSRYSNLLGHPAAQTTEYRVEATRGSILYPLLATVAAAIGDTEIVTLLADFQTTELGHCNFQTWLPNSRTESKIWHGDRFQGSSFGGLKVEGDGNALLVKLRDEIAANADYPQLSTTRLGHWPVLLMACRAFRLPPPPQLWLPLLTDLARRSEPDPPPFMKTLAGGIARFRQAIRSTTSFVSYLVRLDGRVLVAQYVQSEPATAP